MIAQIAHVLSIVRNGVREDSQLDVIIKRFKKNRLAMIGLVITLIYFGLAIFGPFIAPHDPGQIAAGERLSPPNAEHLFGTDSFGRDLFSRVVIGARLSLRVAVLAISFATLVGVSLGLVAGYSRGYVDEAIMRLLDVMFAFPSILLALVIIAIMGPGLDKTILALAVVYTPVMARITRGSALAEREEEYILAAKAYGESSIGIMYRDMLPNLISAVMVQATISFAFSVLSEAALSFVGLSAQPPTPTWGVIISQGKDVIEIAPWVTLFPGLAIMLTVMGLTFLGVGLRDALDPKTDINTTGT